MADAIIECDDKILYIDILESIGINGKRLVFAKEIPYVEDLSMKNILIDLGGSLKKIELRGVILLNGSDYIDKVKEVYDFINVVGSIANKQYLTIQGVYDKEEGLIEKITIDINMAEMKLNISVVMTLTKEVIS